MGDGRLTEKRRREKLRKICLKKYHRRTKVFGGGGDRGLSFVVEKQADKLMARKVLNVVTGSDL